MFVVLGIVDNGEIGHHQHSFSQITVSFLPLMLGMGHLMYVTLKHYGVLPLMLGMGHLMYVALKHYGVLPLMLGMGHLMLLVILKYPIPNIKGSTP
jgi:hypothetical protein